MKKSEGLPFFGKPSDFMICAVFSVSKQSSMYGNFSGLIMSKLPCTTVKFQLNPLRTSTKLSNPTQRLASGIIYVIC